MGGRSLKWGSEIYVILPPDKNKQLPCNARQLFRFIYSL